MMDNICPPHFSYLGSYLDLNRMDDVYRLSSSPHKADKVINPDGISLWAMSFGIL